MVQEKSFYVYTHSRPDGSVFYVGKGTGRRAWWMKKGRNPHHLAIIAKYGVENIIVTIHPVADEAAAFELETKLIAELPGLCNKTSGGEGASGRPISEKMRAVFDAQRKMPKTQHQKDQCKKALAKAWVEKRDVMMANVEKQTAARRGVPRPQHVIDALVKVHKGRKYDGERLEQIRAAQMVAQEAAKAWHSSEEGVAWHVEHGKKTWADRKWVEVKCHECGRTFATPYPTRAKWCDGRCATRGNKRAKGGAVGVRSQRVTPSVLSGKRAVGQ